MIKRFTFLICIIVLTSACSVYRIDSKKISTDFFPQKGRAADVVYIEHISKPHKVIGFVTVTTERSQRIEEVIEKMKQEAAVLGGDAITDIRMEASGSWKKVPAQKILRNAYIRANFTATVAAWQ